MEKEIKEIYKTMSPARRKQEERLLKKEMKEMEKNFKNLKEYLAFLDKYRV